MPPPSKTTHGIPVRLRPGESLLSPGEVVALRYLMAHPDGAHDALLLAHDDAGPNVWGSRLGNLVARELVTRERNTYRITAAGRAQLEDYDATGE